MIAKKNTFKQGYKFLELSLYAFGGLGIEALLVFFVEPLIFNKSFNNFSVTENILHWIITCIIWGGLSYVLIRKAKKSYDFNIFSYKDSIGLLNWIICFGLLATTIVISFIGWNGSKVVKEFIHNGWLKFIFQYIYYFFETILFVLIIVFAQKAGETWSNKKSVPWGGIFVALTWGLAHIFTKGELMVGISTSVVGLIYGIAYLVSKKNLYIAFPLILLMFIL